jgi:prepilin-type N-terminal cleavage/methylation domain-containing protein
MSEPVRSQAGFTLVELLIAMTLMLVILSATLTTLDGFGQRHRLEESRTDAQEGLRRGMDQLQRQLRNLATPSLGVPSIDRALGNDLIFQTADPLKRWARYCLDTSDPLIASGRASLWYQISAGATNTPPAATSCPQTGGWSSTESVGEAVVNALATGSRPATPAFTYNWPAAAKASGDTSAITRIGTDLWVDTNPGAKPKEQHLTSGVFLRNQNQPPVAAFSWSPNAPGVILNASTTTDFEGRRLDYHWYYGASPAIPSGCKPGTPATSYLGSGIVLPATFPAGTTLPQNVTLCVVDPGDLTATRSKEVG